jgi:dTMP kinase
MGKSTQAERLHRRLRAEGQCVTITHEPGGTSLGEELRSLVKSEKGLDAWTELFLMLAARSRITASLIRPALERGEVVVCDRFAPSTIAYQGWGRGLDTKLLESLNHAATGGLKPDLIVLLDAPAEVGFARKHDETLDNFESEPAEFHERVREGYRAMAQGDKNHWFVVDATQSPDRVEELIWERVTYLLKRSLG